MSMEESTLWVPETEAEKEVVRRQMNRLLETSHFRNSRRYPALFRFIVEETLEGRGEFLKERLLGIQVFGRPADYDTAADPVVRVTVAEIRKRIAQYYHDEAHDHEMRIELLPGRYEPEFRPGRDARQEAHLAPAPEGEPIDLHASGASVPVAPAPVPVAPAKTHPHRRAIYMLAATAVVALAALAAWWQLLRPTALDELWSPVIASHRSIMLCMPVAGGKYGQAALAAKSAANASAEQASQMTSTFLDRESMGEDVVFSDVQALARVSNVIALHHADPHYRLNTATTLDDLRQGPAVLIGGMDNQWTLRVLSHLRYQFGGNDQENYWIVDTKENKPTPWSLDTKSHITAVTRDYALVARVHDEDTGQIEMIIAGIGMSGTAAAGEFMTNPAMVEELRRKVGPRFRDGDFEAVLSTDVVNGLAGSAKILAVSTF